MLGYFKRLILKYKKFVLIFIGLIFVYFLPLIFFKIKYSSQIKHSLNNLPKSEAVIIFGTLINENGEITPLLQERLDAGIKITESDKSEKIIVSNTERASIVMKSYILTQEISENSIEIDGQANRTPDTCRYEKLKHPENRKIIFVSQSFHLPRLIYQCKKVGVEGIGFAPEDLNLIDRSQQPFLTSTSIRTQRNFREAGLFWLAILGIYE